MLNSSLLRWLLPSAAALALLVVFNSVRADDAAPAPAAGAKITGTVSDANGPVSGATARLVKAADMPQHGSKGGANKDAAGDAPTKGSKIPAVAETTTDAQGAFSFDKVADGDYVVMVRAKGVGNGHAKVSVVNGANPAALAITLHKQGADGHGGGKDAPAAQ